MTHAAIVSGSWPGSVSTFATWLRSTATIGASLGRGSWGGQSYGSRATKAAADLSRTRAARRCTGGMRTHARILTLAVVSATALAAAWPGPATARGHRPGRPSAGGL